MFETKYKKSFDSLKANMRTTMQNIVNENIVGLKIHSVDFTLAQAICEDRKKGMSEAIFEQYDIDVFLERIKEFVNALVCTLRVYRLENNELVEVQGTLAD